MIKLGPFIFYNLLQIVLVSSKLLQEKLKAVVNDHEYVLLKGNYCEKNLQKIDSVFSRIQACYTAFTSVGGAIVTTSEVDNVINLHKKLTPNHCRIKHLLLQFDERNTQQRYKNLLKHHDRVVFHQFTSQVHIQNSEICIYWDAVS